MNPGIRNVSLLIVDLGWEAPTGNENQTVEDYISDIHSNYKMCEENVRQNFEFGPAEIGVQMKWVKYTSDVNTTLSHIWTAFNKWSVENNVKIFMKSAFENVELPSPSSSSKARWKVISTEGDDIKLEDNFYEKDERNLEGSGSMNSTSEPNNEYEGLVPILGIACGVLVGTIILVLYIQHKRMQSKRCLTRKEIREFYKGFKALKSEGENNCVSLIESSAYKKDYEVDKENFRLSGVSLGSGVFGDVFKGTVIKSGGEIKVAAKTLKKGCPTTTMKGFLSEIKVMCYLGQHENLVGMVGAYTKGLERGKVIIFTEFCGNGSLESYLRRLPKNSGGENEGITAEIDLDWLRRWCVEIANGMEYLTSKNVVYADLATRNVLLDDNLQAKISDFGLSRRLYDYTNYVKKQQEPLPWKWLSPESLQRLEFNEKTDVWAFGVTMWEIYSLGDIPYPGLNWTVDFPAQLINGFRMGKPLYDNDGMYILMIKCWYVDPFKRPTFSELKKSIQSIELEPSHDHQIDNCYKNINNESKKYQNDLVV